MFLSTIESSIDARGRVLVPASFRGALNGDPKFFLYPASGGIGCLEGGGEKLMQGYFDMLSNLPPHDMERRSNVLAIFSDGSEISMDQAGRATLPLNLLQEAGIDRDLLFVGAMDRFQIWEPQRYAQFRRAMNDHAKSNTGGLNRAFYQTRGISQPGDDE